MSRTHHYTAFVVMIASLAGCSSTPVALPAAGASAASSAASPANSGAPGTMASSTASGVALPPHLDPRSLISSERSVYFDFDDFSVRSEYTALIERHGRYLQSKAALSIKVEGNEDERGSAEYNLALGQRRAEAVLKALKIYGAKDAQMEALSWGEERPKSVGHDEAAWAQNRRADLAYPRP